MLSASKILIKRSYTSNSSPLTSDLEYGELAINLADEKIYFKNVENKISFLEVSPYSFLSTLSSVLFIEGNNTVTDVFSQVLGGYNNDVDGAGSTVVNGENNDISGDFAFIINGINNSILSGCEFGGILGGQNNVLNHQNSFILGSNLISHSQDFTYVNNLSTTGKIYGDGSELTGIVAGDIVATTLLRTNSANWESVYTIVQTNSGDWEMGGAGGGSDVSDLSANWENTHTTVQEYSAGWQDSYTLVAASSASWNAAAGQTIIRRFDYVPSTPISFSYSGVAVVGTLDTDAEWNVTRIAYTDVGSVSATQYTYNITWVSRLTATYL